MYFALKALFHYFVLPPGICLLAILAGAVLAGRRYRLGWWLFAAGFASLWLFCTPWVADVLTKRAERYPPLNPATPVDAQAIVVIGGSGHRDFAPEFGGGPIAEGMLMERLTLAAFLARRYHLPLAVSGSPEGEAQSMAVTLTRNFDLPVQWIEHESHDTYENAQYSARLLQPQGIKRIILVTSSTHEWRAAHEFMSAGFQVTPAPASVLSTRERDAHRFAPTAAGLARSYVAIYELVGEPMRHLQSALGIHKQADASTR